MELTQSDRFLQVASPLGPNDLIVRGVSGREAVSECFLYEAEFASTNFSLNASALVSRPMTLKFMLGPQKFQSINGIVQEFTLLPSPDKFARYRARLVPWFWFLMHSTNCRIWQEKTALEIIEDVFASFNVQNYRKRTTRSFAKREYCVQYRESAYAFVTRLMEEEGISFFFEHDERGHYLVLADAPSSFKTCPHAATVKWEPAERASFMSAEDAITQWTRRWTAVTKNWVQTDFNFTTPSTNLQASVPTRSSLAVPGSEKFDYPGGYVDRNAGEALTHLRMEEDETSGDRISGAGNLRGFRAGHKFTFSGHPRRDQAGEYLLLEMTFAASQGGLHGGELHDDDRYDNHFECMPAAITYRPPRRMPKPMIPGPQTAFVTGPSGEEIFVDKYGRVKVQFHWDRYGQSNEKSSCWMRVAQTQASKMWGSVVIPRIGQEVVVEFLEGDPDRPLVTGCVYNAEAMPPYALPDHKTRTVMKTLSSPGGGGFNEIRFEDKKGEEQIFINAQKNMDLRIGNDSFTFVKNEAHTITEADQFSKVGGTEHTEVTGDQNNKVGGTVSHKAGMNWQQKVGMNYALDAGMEIHIKSGMTVVMEAGVSLTLKVGGNFININPAGVFVKGTMVMINSGGAAGSGSGASPTAPTEPKEADTAEAGEKTEPHPPPQPPRTDASSAQATALRSSASSGSATCPAGQ